MPGDRILSYYSLLRSTDQPNEIENIRIALCDLIYQTCPICGRELQLKEFIGEFNSVQENCRDDREILAAKQFRDFMDKLCS